MVLVAATFVSIASLALSSPTARLDALEVPVGVSFAKRSGMVRDGTADEFEALAGRLAVFRFEPA